MKKIIHLFALLLLLLFTHNLKAQVTANFSFGGGGCSNSTIQFIDLSQSTSGSVVAWMWNFGDPGSGNNTSVLKNPLHVFIAAGTYSVALSVQDNMGNTNTATIAVIVTPRPVPFFTVNSFTQCIATNNFVFTNNSTIPAGTMTYLWSFGDDTYSTDTSPVHSYNQAAMYTVKLVARTQSACADSITRIVQVASAVYNSTNLNVCLNQLPYFWNGNNYYVAGAYTDTLTTSSGCDSIIALYLGVNPVSSSFFDTLVCIGQLPYNWNGQAYTAPGTYTKTLTNTYGCDSVLTLQLSVADTLYHDTTVNICSSQLPYVWNGNSYNTAGTYLGTVSSTGGCYNVPRLYLNVQQNITADFTYKIADNSCDSRSRIFYPVASYPNYYWNFGDGSYSNNQYPIHVYSANGNYAVTLITSNICGYDTVLKVLVIQPESNNILPANPAVLFANRECIAADSLWTNYYFDNNTPAYTADDTLLLSLKKNGNYIGTIGDGTFQLKLAATAGSGSNTGILLTNPLITNPSGFWVMNRYWNVVPTLQPTSLVNVRFYFNTQDVDDVNGSFPTHNLNYLNMLFYKTTGGNPDPTTNLVGATAINSITIGNTPDTTHWLSDFLGNNHYSAEFQVSHFSGGGGGATGNGQILPLKLLSFDARKNGKITILNWATVKEASLKKFEVQRSVNSTNFTTLGSVTAHGSVDNNSYQFIDNLPHTSTVYYRIKMIDNDGSINYSTIRKVDKNTGLDFAIYPNPVHILLTFKIESDSRRNVQVEVVGTEGKVLKMLNTLVNNGTTTYPFNIAKLNPGSYILRITTEDKIIIRKFQKL